jgi:perosamine synthetase
MGTPPIPLSRPCTDERELEAVRQVLESGWLAGQGPRGTELERRFASLSGRRHAIAVNNCTAGLHLALLARGIGAGDEVIVADYTFPATAHAALFCGATPVFADVRSDTATIDADSVRALITSRTRAIIGVDSLGVPADWDDLESIAREHSLFLVEDAACATGGEYRDAPCGSFGDVAVYSLHARKGITSGEGGVIVTDDDALAEAMRMASCFGMRSAFARQSTSTLELPEFAVLGFNYKLSDILAAVGCVQFDKLEGFLAERRAIADRYAALLTGLDGVNAPAIPDDRLPTWQTYALTVDSDVSRDRVVMAMRERGVGANIGTYALRDQPVYADQVAPCPVSADLLQRHLAIPMFNGLAEADQERVVDVLGECVALAR